MYHSNLTTGRAVLISPISLMSKSSKWLLGAYSYQVAGIENCIFHPRLGGAPRKRKEIKGGFSPPWSVVFPLTSLWNESLTIMWKNKADGAQIPSHASTGQPEMWPWSNAKATTSSLDPFSSFIPPVVDGEFRNRRHYKRLEDPCDYFCLSTTFLG